MMRLAYADPPYPGQADRHYSHDPSCAEVDHADLIDRLSAYDGWALSSGANLAALQYVVPLLPEGTRVCVWVKPFASFKPGVNPGYAWEPVFVKPARRLGRDVPTVRDWIAANITIKKGLSGSKPTGFCQWLFQVMGAESGDEFLDMFPGTGAVGRAWDKYCKVSNLKGLPLLNYGN